MNIIYLSTVFPKEKDSATIYTDLAEALVKKGHKVTVVAAEDRKKNKKLKRTWERGCEVLRVPIGSLYNVSLLKKGCSIITLSFFMKRAIKKISNRTYDLILFESPPVTMAAVVGYGKKIYQAPAFLMMKDIFPQNAVDLGIIKKNSFLYYFLKKKEKHLYQVADKIGCMSKKNCEYLLEHNTLSQEKVSIFPNTKAVRKHKKVIDVKEQRKKYGIPLNSVVFLFGGNMGKPQGMDFLCSGIVELEHYQPAFFVLVGRGTERKKVRGYLKNKKNVLLLENLPREEYENLTSACDVGIISLDYGFTIPNIPSRILSYMEYGMPIIAATDKITDIRTMIEEVGCGLWCPSNSIDNFCHNVKWLAENKEKRVAMGGQGRTYLEEKFDVSKSVELLENYMIKK